MAWMLATMAAASVASGFISKNSAEKEVGAENKRIDGEIELRRNQMRNVLKSHEISTMSKYIDNSSAGAKRISKAMLSGGTLGNAAAVNQLKSFVMDNDLTLMKLDRNTKMDKLNTEISNLERNRPPEAGWGDFFAGAAKGAIPFLPSAGQEAADYFSGGTDDTTGGK